MSVLQSVTSQLTQQVSTDIQYFMKGIFNVVNNADIQIIYI